MMLCRAIKSLCGYSKLLLFLIVLCIAFSVAACTSEKAFSVECTSIRVDPDTHDVNLTVVVTNIGGAVKYDGLLSSYFYDATLTSADGTEYKWLFEVFSPVMGERYFKNREKTDHVYRFNNVEESGTYTLAFKFMGMILQIPDIEIVIPE